MGIVVVWGYVVSGGGGVGVMGIVVEWGYRVSSGGGDVGLWS